MVIRKEYAGMRKMRGMEDVNIQCIVEYSTVNGADIIDYEAHILFMIDIFTFVKHHRVG